MLELITLALFQIASLTGTPTPESDTPTQPQTETSTTKTPPPADPGIGGEGWDNG